MARLLVNDSRFVGRQEAMLSARRTARTALNWLAPELGMVTDGGLLAASPESVKVRIPYAFGLLCGSGLARIVSVMPVDSLQFANANPGGLAWQSGGGSYDFPGSLVLSATSDTATCTADSIRVLPGGRLVNVIGWIFTPPAGSVAYLYETVTYKFAPSTELSGRVGLWRKAGSAAYEELVTPFDTAASFGFLVGSSSTALDVPPGNLQTVMGLELRLIGASEYVPRGAPRAQTFELVTQVRFHNRTN